MKLSLRQWLSLTGAVAGCHLALPAMANTCTWDGASGPMDFQANVGNVYDPRDARIGTVIGVIDKFVTTTNPGNLGITCTNDGSVTLNFSAQPPHRQIDGRTTPSGGKIPAGRFS